MTDWPPLFGRDRWLDAALLQPRMDVDALLPQLDTGDLWFSTGSPRVFSASFLIRLGTRSEWSHVGMLLRDGGNIELIEAPGSADLRRVPVKTALRGAGRGARIVIARPLAFAGAAFPGAPAAAAVDDLRGAILASAGRDFPRGYDLWEFLKIACVLALGGLARRWRWTPILGAAARALPARHRDGRKVKAPDKNAADQSARQAAYTCAELIAELLACNEDYAACFDLAQDSDDFLSPATIAERIPLVVLGRLR